MKSAIASLRSLTLPFGATSGARIVLDGINGEIRIYDNNDDLLMQLDAEGFKIYDGNGNLRIWLAIPGGTNSAYSIIEWYTTRSDQTLPGFISLYDTVARNRMVISPGENDDRGCMEWTLVPEDADILKEAMLQAVCYTLDKVDNIRPTIDLTGASSQAGKEPVTVVHNLQWGTPNAFGTTPTILGTYGRGLIAWGEQTGNVTLSTTAGTLTTVVTTGQAQVTAGRRYRVTFSGGWDLLTGGSGFTVTDTWTVEFLRSVNGGAYGNFWGPQIIARCFAAVATRYPTFATVAYYTPAASALINWRISATKAAGAGTVTSVMETNAGATPMQLAIEDVGAAL